MKGVEREERRAGKSLSTSWKLVTRSIEIQGNHLFRIFIICPLLLFPKSTNPQQSYSNKDPVVNPR
jgi:hypothetical protein